MEQQQITLSLQSLDEKDQNAAQGEDGSDLVYSNSILESNDNQEMLYQSCQEKSSISKYSILNNLCENQNTQNSFVKWKNFGTKNVGNYMHQFTSDQFDGQRQVAFKKNTKIDKVYQNGNLRITRRRTLSIPKQVDLKVCDIISKTVQKGLTFKKNTLPALELKQAKSNSERRSENRSPQSQRNKLKIGKDTRKQKNLFQQVNNNTKKYSIFEQSQPKSIRLRRNEQTEKIHLRKIIQNRPMQVHIEDVELTYKKTFRT